MNWSEELEEKLRRRNQILFAKDGAFLFELDQQILSAGQKAAILWALDFAKESVLLLESAHPEEDRPRRALNASRLWAEGKLKMPAAQREILRCHAWAKELQSPEETALCHAVGQACSTVHTIRHAIGYPMYDLTAIVRRLGFPQCRPQLLLRQQQYRERLEYWASNAGDVTEWADFLEKTTKTTAGANTPAAGKY